MVFRSDKSPFATAARLAFALRKPTGFAATRRQLLFLDLRDSYVLISPCFPIFVKQHQESYLFGFLSIYESMRFLCETPRMRKHIINATEPNRPGTSEEWLNLEEIARVEVSSEDPKYPIESAFRREESIGWRAGQPGEQTIRLLFDEPKDLRRIWLRFSEPQVERTQQFALRWADSQTGPFREIVRQQWNFNPRSSTIEVEDYKVDLHHVLALELIIDPDLGKNQAFVALADWRIA